MWRNFPSVMRSMMLAMLSSSPQVATLRVITWPTGNASAAGAVFGDRAHDVALGQYAGEAPSCAADQNRADAVRTEQTRRRRQIRRRLDADNVAARLGGQNGFDVHGSLLGSPAADLIPAMSPGF